LLRWRVLRFASTLAAFALLLVLAACGGRMVAVPGGPPQSPFAGPKFPAGAGPIRPEPLAPPSGGPVKVALLVPLSGPNAELGKAMLEAAQLALFTTGSERLTLVPRDTAGAAGGAAGAARSAISEGAQLILGPLLAAEVDAVKPIAAEAKVNVIAFATQTQVAGGNVFLIGFLPRQEVAREVSFARERGLRRFAALAPNSQYGRLIADALREAASASGGTLGRIEYIDARSADAGAAVQRLLGGGPAAAAAGESPAAAAPARIGFDALLLPMGGDQLKQIARRLREAGVDTAKVRLLGSGLWDEPTIGDEPALYGGWFAASPPEQRREFENRFRATYGHPAPRLASLAFDAAALAAVLAKSGGDPFTQEAILNPGGFTGVDGLFRFTSQGLVQRGLAVLEIGPGGNAAVSPAPRDFRDLSF
jgi:ABC-type branched-subunit amino acid transport system substrate-binding protein